MAMVAWLNGGYFILEPSVLDLIDGDSCIWEQVPLNTLAHAGELSAYLHKNFWHPMDTLRDRQKLEELWTTGSEGTVESLELIWTKHLLKFLGSKKGVSDGTYRIQRKLVGVMA